MRVEESLLEGVGEGVEKVFDDGIIPDSEHPHSPQQFRLAGEDSPHNLK